MTVPFLDLKAINLAQAQALEAAFHRVLHSGWYVLGEEVASFESQFAAYCGASQAIGVANGLDAIFLILKGYGIGPGDEVIVPSNTYIATWLAVTHCGATPVPVEPVEATYNLDPARIADRSTYPDPHRYAVGVSTVVVNGQVVVDGGDHTGALPGRVIMRGA